MRPWLLGGLLVIAGIAAFAVGRFWLFAPDSRGSDKASPAVGSAFRELTGTGDRTTSTFEIADAWKIEWSHTTPRFAIAVEGDHSPGTVVNRIASGSGTTRALPGGTFRLRVTASGNGEWTIRVVRPS